MREIVSIEHLGVHFGSRTIIEDLSFGLSRGEAFGFLGGNGSGKTTTIRALLGLISPTRGTLLVDGEAYRPGAPTPVGYLPEE